MCIRLFLLVLLLMPPRLRVAPQVIPHWVPSPPAGLAAHERKSMLFFRMFLCLVYYFGVFFCLIFTVFRHLGDGWLPFLSANITAINRERRRLRLYLKRSNYAGVDSTVLIFLLFLPLFSFYRPLIGFAMLSP